MVASIAGSYGIDEVPLDMRDVTQTDAEMVPALCEAAVWLDDVGVVLRIRKPSQAIRNALARPI